MNLENQRMKIVDESILFFSMDSLSKFSLKLSTFRGYKGIYSRVYKECEKSCFKVGCMSRELTTWPDRKFCPVVL